MTMKLKDLPKSINVYGQRTKIQVKELPGLVGKADFRRKTIFITPTAESEGILRETLLHETIHIILNRLGITPQLVSHEVDEIICETIAKCLAENDL